jgi:hypothetical protein
MSGAVVVGTWNPSGTSYYDWVVNSPDGLTPLQVFTGILLFTAAVGLLRMAFASSSYLGIATILALLIMAVVLAVGLGIVDFEDVSFTAYTIEVLISLTIAIGASWAYAQRKLSGERDVLKSPP